MNGERTRFATGCSGWRAPFPARGSGLEMGSQHLGAGTHALRLPINVQAGRFHHVRARQARTCPRNVPTWLRRWATMRSAKTFVGSGACRSGALVLRFRGECSCTLPVPSAVSVAKIEQRRSHFAWLSASHRRAWPVRVTLLRGCHVNGLLRTGVAVAVMEGVIP